MGSISLTRERPLALYIGIAESKPLDHQAGPLISLNFDTSPVKMDRLLPIPPHYVTPQTEFQFLSNTYKVYTQPDGVLRGST